MKSSTHVWMPKDHLLQNWFPFGWAAYTKNIKSQQWQTPSDVEIQGQVSLAKKVNIKNIKALFH
jgi:hypothetical protein